MKHSPAILFNNCRKFPHGKRYGRGAFFDLRTEGVQASQATDLKRGDVCVVATPAANNRIAFDWHEFQRETIDPETGFRVFRGKPVKSDVVARGKATKHPLYGAFFNQNGNFKRQSTLRAPE